MYKVLRYLVLGPVLFAAALSCTAAVTPELDLGAYQGKVVYVDFWASWCSPCRQSFPWMQTMLEKYGKDGLVIVAVNVDQERRLADEFLKERPTAFPVIFDSAGSLAARFNVQTMPASYLFDRKGQQRVHHLGFHESRRDGYEQEIRALLAESVTKP